MKFAIYVIRAAVIQAYEPGQLHWLDVISTYVLSIRSACRGGTRSPPTRAMPLLTITGARANPTVRLRFGLTNCGILQRGSGLSCGGIQVYSRTTPSVGTDASDGS